jgi:hypothetical protein
MVVWKKIPLSELENRFSASNTGFIRNDRTETIYKPAFRGEYLAVALYINKKNKTYSVHRLVAITFLKKSEGCDIVNHKDGNKENNHVNNLIWCTHSENSRHAIDNNISYTQNVPVLHNELQLEYSNIIEASKETGYTIDDILRSCNIDNDEWSFVERTEYIEDNVESKQIPGYSKYYATKDGRVFKYATKAISKIHANKHGYSTVKIRRDDGKSDNFLLHQLIALTFLSNNENHKCVNHKDSNRYNNSVDNLEYISYRDNMLHRRAKEKENEPKRPVLCTNWSTKEEKQYDSIYELQKDCPVTMRNIRRVLRGAQKTSGLYTFKYIDEDKIE